MISIIIYVDDQEFVARTVKSVLLATPSSLLTEVILIDDTGVMEYTPSDTRVRVIVQDSPVGRAVGRNRGAAEATGEVLVFLNQTCRPSDDWVVSLLEVVREDPRTIAGPIITGLDTNLWSADPGQSLKWSWRWDLTPRDAYDDGQDWAVSLGSDCLAVASDWFRELGGFDELSRGGEQQEFCLRGWLCGGRVVPVRGSRVASLSHEQVPDSVTKVRTAETWFGPLRDRFYRSSGLQDGQVDFGCLGQLSRVQSSLQIRDMRWLSDRYLPELGRIWDLRDQHRGKSVAIVCDGPSLDRINKWMVMRHEVIIGVDYVASLYPCHYVVSLQREPVRSLLMSGKYVQSQLILPSVLLGPDGRGQTAVREVAPAAITYELGEPGVSQHTVDPPFVNYGSPVLTAVQFAGFIGASDVTLYGWDGGLVDGRSHTKAVEHYNDGMYWEDGESTSQRYDYYNNGLQQLRRLLAGYRIPVMRVCYA